MTESRPVNLSTSGPPETVLPEEPAALRHALEQAKHSESNPLTAIGAIHQILESQSQRRFHLEHLGMRLGNSGKQNRIILGRLAGIG